MRMRTGGPAKIHHHLKYRGKDWNVVAPTPEEIAAFKRLLDRLVLAEQHAAREHERYQAELRKRVDATEIEDYEIQLELNLHLHSGDSAFEEDEDSHFIDIASSGRPGPEGFTYDWDIELYEGYPLHGYPHPHLFHDLHDHSHIPIRDLLRVGSIWLDVDFTVQCWLRQEHRP